MAMWDKHTRADDPEDDGRTIADMSDLAPHRNWLGGWTESTGRNTRQELTPPPQAQPREDRPWEQPPAFDREQRFWAVMGALKASLLIGLVYVVGFGLFGWFLLSIWK